MLSAGRMAYLATDMDVDWADIKSMESKLWSTPSSDTVNTYAPNQAQWLRIRVTNRGQSVGGFRLETRWPLLEHIEMRVLRDDTFGPVQSAGKNYPGAATASNENIAFHFDLEGGESATIYLRAIDSYVLYLPTFVWSEEAHEQHSNIRLIIFSMVLGTLLVMTLYNASLYLFTRDGMYLVYTNSVFSALLLVLTMTGLGKVLVWGDHSWFVHNAYSVFSGYCFLSVSYFFRVFINLKEHGGWVLKFNTSVLSVWTLILIGNLLGFQNLTVPIMGPAGVITSVGGTICALYLWSRGSQAAKYFSIAWAPASLATVYGILTLFGVLNYLSVLEYMQSWSFAFEMVVLSVALAERINSEREARESAQALALERQQAILQLKEKANVELEEQVDVRTRELQLVLSELADSNTALAELTKTDALTQISNRRHFDELAELEIVRAMRSEQPLSVMLIDIDHFKAVNDTYGHVAGDRCLKLTARAISEIVARETDILARYGGEEFAVILPDTDVERAVLVAERIRKAIQDIAIIYEGNSISITASIGVVGTIVPRGCAVDQLVDTADKALYLAKQNGRNRVESRAMKGDEPDGRQVL